MEGTREPNAAEQSRGIWPNGIIHQSMQYHTYIYCITLIEHSALSIGYRVSSIEHRASSIEPGVYIALFSRVPTLGETVMPTTSLDFSQPSFHSDDIIIIVGTFNPICRFVLFFSWLVARSLSERISDFMLSDSLTLANRSTADGSLDHSPYRINPL